MQPKIGCGTCVGCQRLPRAGEGQRRLTSEPAQAMTKLCHACTADPKAAAADDDLGVRDFHAEFGLRGSRVHGCKTLLPTFRYNGGIDRRGFLDGAAKFAVGGITAAGLLEALSPKFAQAQQVLAADPRIKGAMVEFTSPKGYGNARGYLVRPANASGPLPTVLVVHENRGLNPHIEDTTRPPRARQLHRLRARCAVPARRVPR